MKKGFSFIILVAVALLTLAYQADRFPVSASLASADMTSTLSSQAGKPGIAFQVSTPAVPMSVSRLPASVTQPLEIEEVEAQN
jgi:hypothetical protein